MSKKLKSVFTDDMDHCYYTGNAPVERHHIFGGSRKAASEKYGYVVPLRPDLHPNGVFAGQAARTVDIALKTMAQRHFEENHGTRAEFISIFGKSYILEDNENEFSSFDGPTH